jgi:hypothetical protein
MSEEKDLEKREECSKSEEVLKHLHGIDLLVANVIPTTKYFESRFDFLQHQINELREGQKHLEGMMNYRFEQVEKRFEQVDANLRDFKAAVDKRFEQVDKRFEQVDKRFEQIVAAIDRLTDKLDQRDERQRSFTIRMFTVAISISFLGVLGVLLKMIGIL